MGRDKLIRIAIVTPGSQDGQGHLQLSAPMCSGATSSAHMRGPHQHPLTPGWVLLYGNPKEQPHLYFKLLIFAKEKVVLINGKHSFISVHVPKFPNSFVLHSWGLLPLPRYENG